MNDPSNRPRRPARRPDSPARTAMDVRPSNEMGGRADRPPPRRSRPVETRSPVDDDSGDGEPTPFRQHSHKLPTTGGGNGTSRVPSRVAGNAGGMDQALAKANAPDLPLTQLGGNIRTILDTHAPHQAAVLFEQINRLRRYADATEQLQDYQDAITATGLAGRLALKTIELTIGKQVNINANIRNQSGVMDWDRIPKDVQEKFLEVLAHADQSTVDVIPVPEGVTAPQTDEAAYTIPEDPYEFEDTPKVDE